VFEAPRGCPSRTRRAVLAGVLAAALAPATASADIVVLTNGRTLTVTAAVVDGNTVRLSMPGGGEVRIARDIVQEIAANPTALAKARAERAFLESPAAAQPELDRSAIRRLVDQIAARVGLDRRLAHAVVHTESNYQPFVISPKGAVGLMQIMPALVRQYGLNDPFDPSHNLEAGMRHLRRLLRRFDIRQALAAYNAGESAVARYGGVPPYRETQDYVHRILAAIR
jgi:soluble lytic murein transglycosylase-like protein